MSTLKRKRTLKKQAHHRRARMRVRSKVKGSEERPRLSVHKSLKYIYAQVINDSTGRTLAQASSLEAAVRGAAEGKGSTKRAARAVGTMIAERAKQQGIDKVVFDRGGYVYHGQVKELADGAREGGLQF